MILGAGCIGLMTLLSVKAHGCGKTIVCDLVDAKLEKAKELGADICINSGRTACNLSPSPPRTNCRFGKNVLKTVITIGLCST